MTEPPLTLADVKLAVAYMKARHIEPFPDGNYEMAILPSKMREAFEAGLNPYTPIRGWVPLAIPAS